MVKREKSPVIREDAKYLVVHQPYPLNADFDLPGDYIEFAFWIALILKDYRHVWGIHHKPSARSMVIVEVDRKLNLSGLLGEHRWKDILKKPEKDEEPRVSKVYYSIYKTTGEAWKDHWKRIQVEHDWFTQRGWNLTDGPFKYPYPDSLWCPPLAEDPTGKPIARPLPGPEKPPPPNSPSLVPGRVQANSGSTGASTPTSTRSPSVASGSSTPASGATSQSGGGSAKGKKGKGGAGDGRRGRPANIQNPSSGFVQTLAAGNNNPWERISTAPHPSSSGASSPMPASSRSPSALSYSNSVTASRTPTSSAFPPLFTPPGLSKRVNTAPLGSPLTATSTTAWSTRAPPSSASFSASRPLSPVSAFASASLTPSPEHPSPLFNFAPTSLASPVSSVTPPSRADQVDLEVPFEPPGLGLPANFGSTRTNNTRLNKGKAKATQKEMEEEETAKVRERERAEAEERAVLSLAGLSLKTSEDDEDEDGDGMYAPFDENNDDDNDSYRDVGYAGLAQSSWRAASTNGTAKLWSSAETSSQKSGGGASATSTGSTASGSAGGIVDLWASETLEPTESSPLCSIHGIKCTKGICSEYRKSVRDKKRAEERAEREKKMKERQDAQAEKRKERRKGKGIRSVRSIRSRGREVEPVSEEEEEEKENEEEEVKGVEVVEEVEVVKEVTVVKEVEVVVVVEEEVEDEVEEVEEPKEQEQEKEEEKKQEEAPKTLEDKKAARKATRAWKFNPPKVAET